MNLILNLISVCLKNSLKYAAHSNAHGRVFEAAP